jgi:hypothetical protein
MSVEPAVVGRLVLRQLKVTLKLAVLLAAAMNAPASALSSNPNSTPTSSGASAKARSRLIRAWGGRLYPGDRLLEGLLGLFGHQPPVAQPPRDRTGRGLVNLYQDGAAVLQRKLHQPAHHPSPQATVAASWTAASYPTRSRRRWSRLLRR